MDRRTFLASLAGSAAASAQTASQRPNIILIYADDLGYGDLGVYGHPEIRTPNLNRMAAEGVKFTNFYSASSLCTPSRAALLTGRYPVRSGMVRVLFPREESGLPASEVTIAELLRGQGYRTACLGKWHLGDQPASRPTRHGFDYYCGILYSNNMDPRYDHGLPWPCPLSLYRNEDAVETPIVQETLTSRLSGEAVKFIGENKARPFFLYVAHPMPHTPWFASPKFAGRSRYGRYGDAIEEIDDGVGRILDAVRDAGVESNTLLMFASDNGGATGRNAGSNGMLRGGKGSSWEGGFRVPFIARWPGRVAPGAVSSELTSTIDLFPTFAALSGGAPPSDRDIDGLNIWPAIASNAPSPRKEFFYFNSNMESEAQILAIRSGDWKLHFQFEEAIARDFRPSALYNVVADPGERFDQMAHEPATVERLTARTRQFAAQLQPGPLSPPLRDDMLRPDARKRRESKNRK